MYRSFAGQITPSQRELIRGTVERIAARTVPRNGTGKGNVAPWIFGAGDIKVRHTQMRLLEAGNGALAIWLRAPLFATYWQTSPLSITFPCGPVPRFIDKYYVKQETGGTIGRNALSARKNHELV
jgi:hypothetical protein